MSLSLGNVFESTDDKESNIAKDIAINEWLSHKVTQDFVSSLGVQEKLLLATLIEEPYAESSHQKVIIGQLTGLSSIKKAFLEERAIGNENA